MEASRELVGPLFQPVEWGEPRVDVTVREDPGFLVPAGTVTLLLADIGGLTPRWEERAAEMPELLADLGGVVDEVIGRHHGVRPEEQGEGDSFVAAFARASDAGGGAPGPPRALSAAPP